MEDESKDSSQEAKWTYSAGDQAISSDAGDFAASQASAPLELPSIQWNASEYIEHEKSFGWYFALAGSGVALTALIYLITQDVLASAVVFLAIISIAVFAGRKPETKEYSVNENGVKVGDKSFRYSQFRSFSVVEEGAIDSIWLKPLRRFSPAVIIYFAPEDEEKIIEVLSNFLPHEDRELDMIDRFSKRVRF